MIRELSFGAHNELAWSLLSGSFNDCEVTNGMESFHLPYEGFSKWYLPIHSHLPSSSFSHFSPRILEKEKKEGGLAIPPFSSKPTTLL